MACLLGGGGVWRFVGGFGGVVRGLFLFSLGVGGFDGGLVVFVGFVRLWSFLALVCVALGFVCVFAGCVGRGFRGLVVWGAGAVCVLCWCVGRSVGCLVAF